MTGAVEAELAALRAERDSLEERALEAEAMAEQLADALADAQRRLAATSTSVGTPREPDDGRHLTLFDHASGPPGKRIAADGSDLAVLPVALGSVAVVVALVAVITVAAGRFSFVTVALLVAAAGLAWAALRTRVTPVTVQVDDGVVRVVEGGVPRTFDLRNDSVKLDVQGRPGDPGWRVRLYRRALEPADVDASVVDPEEFMAVVREFRPGV